MKKRTLIKGLLLSALTALALVVNLNTPYKGQMATSQSSAPIVAEWIGQNTYAQSSPTPTPTQAKPKEAPTTDETIKKIASRTNLIYKLFHPLIFFFTKHISNFLGTDLVYGGKMGEMLHAIWVVSRNIVNIVFVIILLFLAVRHIFGSDENSDIKKILPTFALMLIAVNFTWLGGKLIVDAANVATNVVFSIPSGVKGVVDLTKDAKCEILDGGTKTNFYCTPSAIYSGTSATKEINLTTEQCNKLPENDTYKDIYATNVKDGYSETYPEGSDKNGDLVDKESPFYNTRTFCWDNLDIGKFDSSNAAYQLTYSMARLSNLPKAQNTTSIVDLGIGTIFAAVIMVVYLISFGALFIALVFRVAFLWIIVAFSPFIVLVYFLKKAGLEGFTGGDEIGKFLSLGAFAKWAFAPAQVAAIWSVGFIMVTTGQTSTTDIFSKLDNTGRVTGQFYQVSSIFMGMNSLKEIIWLIMTIIIVWVGTFAVLGKLEGISAITNKINEKGKTFANLIGTAPLWAPIIPTLQNGKLDWSKRTNVQSLDPTSALAKAKAHYTGSAYADTNKMNEFNINFKKAIAGVVATDFNTKDPKLLLKAFEKHTNGMGASYIKNASEPDIVRILKGNSATRERAEEIGKILKTHADSNSPAAISVQPPKATPRDLNKTDIQSAVQAGVKSGMKDAKDDELSKAWEIVKNKEGNKTLNNAQLSQKTIDEIKKLRKEGSAAPPSATGGSAPSSAGRTPTNPPAGGTPPAGQ